MYEPGFLATRIQWLRFVLRRLDAGQLFVSLGLLPLENELASRAVAAFAWAAQRRHGPLRVDEIFDERVAARFPPGTISSDLWRSELFTAAQQVVKITTVREPYRREILDETRDLLESDLARMEAIVRRGGTFYLTPEGHYTVNGRMLPMRGVIERLAPLATIYLAGVSYDPFVSRRLPMLYRIVRFDGAGIEPMRKTLAAVRPVTASQLLGTWLHSQTDRFTLGQAVSAVETALAALPPSLFVDPELRRNAKTMIRRALPLMQRWNILQRDGEHYALAPERRHPQFPFVGDIIAYQASFLAETIENVAYAPAPQSANVRIGRGEIAATSDQRL